MYIHICLHICIYIYIYISLGALQEKLVVVRREGDDRVDGLRVEDVLSGKRDGLFYTSRLVRVILAQGPC